jgi:hypothetical protein
MAIDRKHIAWVVAAVAVAAVPLSFFGPEGLRMVVIGLLMLAGPGTALVLYIRLGSAGTDADGAGAHRSAAQSTLPLAISIAVASSLALSTIVATAMVSEPRGSRSLRRVRHDHLFGWSCHRRGGGHV